MESTERQSKNRRTTWLLVGMVVLMFGFGFALVPLYNLLCQVTGTQSIALRAEAGKTEVLAQGIDESRLVTVKFDSTVNPDLPWDFAPAIPMLEVHPGQIYEVNFSAKNRSSASVTGQAIPSVAPWQATAYFHKLECFCFNRQSLDGNQHADMPLRFMVSPELPKEINSLTLSYSFMRLRTDQEQPQPTEAEPPPIITDKHQPLTSL
jgi:cytochrome c oxidase assembly protein subunit 11